MNDDKKPHWKDRMVPLTRAHQIADPPWATAEDEQELERLTRLKQAIAWAEFRKNLNLPPPGRIPHWREMLTPERQRERNKRIEDFKRLRMEFEPPVPPEWRDGYGPPPSDPKSRLYERKMPLGLASGIQSIYPKK